MRPSLRPQNLPPPMEDKDDEPMVWIHKSGTKYHSNKDCSGMNNPAEVTKPVAIARGYRLCPYYYHKDTASSHDAFPAISLHCGRCYDEEICGRCTTCPAGEDLGQTGRGTEPGNHGQLGDTVYADLAEASLQTHEAAASGPVRDPCG